MDIKIDDLRHPAVIALLRDHLESMHTVTPAGSVHALDLAALRKPDITFWTAWESSQLHGCGALKQLSTYDGEIKSMRTASQHLRKGVAARLLQHIIDEGVRRKYRQLFLETGASAAFSPARALYHRFGFTRCGPFHGYAEDKNSVFMVRQLS
jgi:putative acetyltransferase